MEKIKYLVIIYTMFTGGNPHSAPVGGRRRRKSYRKGSKKRRSVRRKGTKKRSSSRKRRSTRRRRH